LGENQRLLLEKVEQLTLMLIEQQKQIETLKAAVNSCKE
jgi:flagellar biogenesis protein FliO